MSLIALLISLVVTGLIVGGLARLALPGKDPMSIPMTIALGIAGSFVGGLIYTALFGRNGGSIVLSVLVATLFVYLVRRQRGGSVTRPGGGTRARVR
jgi:uncharacterized membrane protein YeaQ/YmgE (transglycosylase-associated protein family)